MYVISDSSHENMYAISDISDSWAHGRSLSAK